MAEEEEDFGALPIPDRFVHKNWKVRKSGYEDAAKAFEATPDESDPTFKPFMLDSGLWKGAVLDSNVAAQQEGVAALCAFLKYGGQEACKRSRSVTITPLVEKGLASMKAGTKQSSLETILLYVELDKADPILEDLRAGLSNKQPKVVAATLVALRELYHAYGVKIVEPKSTVKALPKVFGHADKNVRAEATNLTVELYRWLRDALKKILWDELKPVQQQDLEKLFEKVNSEPPPKQARMLRSQQEKAEAKAATGGDDIEAEGEAGEAAEEEPEIDLAEPKDVISKIPPDFYENMASAKWKDRKDALDAFYAEANAEKIKDGHFEEVIQVLAKSMKDANIAVVSVAAASIEVLARGLRKSFAKHRGKIMPAIMERLKDKKLAEPLGKALDSVFASSSFSDCLEDTLEFLKHKNPQVKAETLSFLIRCLKMTREAPSKVECKSIADAATKLLTESSEATRNGGAEVLGTLMKIMGERAMGPYMEGLDDIRKAKIKEYFDKAEVKAKDKPKAAAPAPKAAAPTLTKRTVTTKKPPASHGYKAPSKRASTPQSEPRSPPAKTTQPTKAIPTKLTVPKTSLAGPVGMKKKLPGAGPPPSFASPARRNITPLSDDEAAPAPRIGLGRGLAGRPLGKPSAAPSELPPPAAPSGLSAAGREELEDLRADRDRLQRTTDDMRAEKSRLTSQIHELQNHNAELIEDHTRDVLSIKAKETQLVRARSDAEAAEGMVQRLQRENERLKRELSRTARSGPDSPLADDRIYRDPNSNSLSSTLSQPPPYERSASGVSEGGDYLGSPSEEKENGSLDGPTAKPSLSRGASGARMEEDGERPVADWKRAGEVTSQLKARIEQMKVRSILQELKRRIANIIAGQTRAFQAPMSVSVVPQYPF